MAYVPIEDVIPPHIVYAGEDTSKVDRFHLKVSANEMAFTEQNQEKTVILSNIGWDKLNLNRIVNVNSLFVIEQELPAVLLPGKQYTLRVRYNSAAQQAGGIYIDVGNSYGNKFIALTGLVTP